MPVPILVIMTNAQLVLQPRGGSRHNGPQNFERSVRRGVRIADIASELGDDLPALSRLFPDGTARLWGSTPTASTGNAKAVALRDRRAGDRILFYADMGFFAEATILHVFRNADVARAVWGADEEGATWEHIVALGDVQEYESPIPADSVLTPLGLSAPLRSITLIPADRHARLGDLHAEQASPRYWLLQCNPAVWDVWAWWQDNTMELDRWTVAIHHQDLRPGDRFAFWISGAAAGVYGLGEITSAVHRATNFDSYWKEQPPSEADVVDLRFDRYLFDAPITKERLQSDPDFARARILRMPGGANPFPLTPAEWHVLEASAAHSRTNRPRRSETVLTSRPVGDVPEDTTSSNNGGPRTVTYPEARLIKQYSEFLGRELRCLVGRLPTGEELVCDVFDDRQTMIIEAKASTSRQDVRMAIGQLLDYQHHLRPDASLAVLLPARPAPSLIDLLKATGMELIYCEDGTFHSTRAPLTAQGAPVER